MELNLLTPNKQPTLRVAHEALLKSWQLARDQIKQDQGRLLVRARLEKLSQRWYAAAPETRPGLLLPTGLQLEEAEDLLNVWGEELPLQMRAHIEASIQAETQRQQQERETREELERRLVEANHNLGLVLLEKTTSERQHGNLSKSRAYLLNAINLLKPEPHNWELIAEINDVLVNFIPLVSQAPVINEYMQHQASSVTCLAFSPDGRSLAIGYGVRTIIWSLPNCQSTRILMEHTHSILCLTYSSNGYLAVGTEDGTVFIWNLSDQSPHDPVIFRHNRPVCSLAFRPNSNQIAVGYADGTLHLWDMTNGTMPTRPQGFNVPYGINVTLNRPGYGLFAGTDGHLGAVLSLAFHPQGHKLISGGQDNVIRLWNLGAETNGVKEITGHTGAVYTLVFQLHGNFFVSGSQDKTIRLWNTDTGKQQLILDGHEGTIKKVAFGLQGQFLLSEAADNTIRLWNIKDLWFKGRSNQAVLVLNKSCDSVISSAISADRFTMANGLSNGDVQLWDLARIWDLVSKQPDGFGQSNNTNTDNLAIITDTNSNLYLKDLIQNITLFTLKTNIEKYTYFRLGDQGRILFLVSDNSIMQLWDLSILLTIYDHYCAKNLAIHLNQLEQNFGYSLKGIKLYPCTYSSSQWSKLPLTGNHSTTLNNMRHNHGI